MQLVCKKRILMSLPDTLRIEISILNNFDPYLLFKKKKFCEQNYKNFPVTYADLYEFLILRTSTYTKQQLKSYKSLEAYKFYVDGWIRDMKYEIVYRHFVIIAQVCVFIYCFIVIV